MTAGLTYAFQPDFVSGVGVCWGEVRIKKSKIPERMKPAKISVCKSMTPALISQMTKSQNGIQIMVAQKMPRGLIKKNYHNKLEVSIYIFINKYSWYERKP
jgi:hypothetical protein